MKNKIIAHLLKGETDFWKLVPEFVHLKTYSDAIKELQKEEMIVIEKSIISLTDSGKKYAEENGIKPKEELNNLWDIEIDKKLLEDFKRLRNPVKRFIKYDQIQLTAESVIRKVEIMRRRDDLDDKDIICIGDDDQLAIALALTKKPKSITVVDLDENILAHDRKVLKELGYDGNCVSLNLMDGTPGEIKGKFDVFCTEPSDVLFGMKTFFSRGIESLKKEGGIGYLGVPHIYFFNDELTDVQSYALKAGGHFTDILHQFYCYKIQQGEESDITWIEGLPKGVEAPTMEWLYTCLYRIKFDEGHRPLVIGNAKRDDVLVVDQSYHL